MYLCQSHYCSSSTLYNIVTSKSLWLTNPSYSNDPQEDLIFPELLEKIFFENEGLNPKLLTQITNILWSSKNIYKPFAFSFSSNGDDVNQWKEYADNGNGFKLVFYFDGDNFELKEEVDLYSLQSNSIKFYRTIYNTNKQEILIRELLHNHIINNKIIEQDLFSIKLRLYSILFKNIGYSGENELRMIVWSNLSNYKKNVRYFHKKNSIFPYLNLPLVKIPLLIKIGIVIGPNCVTNRFDLINFLMQQESTDSIDISYEGKSEVMIRQKY